ncbi:MAG: tRNA modification GTPase [Phycisphaerales bacterium]|nr:tRNA modification GTPase [Phycisphaerales bacterium]
MITGDTIVALSSTPGPAARCIVRLSGPEAVRFVQQMIENPLPLAEFSSACRVAIRLETKNENGPENKSAAKTGDLRVPGVWLYHFAASRSYTDEEVIELHLPGNPWLARQVLDRLIHAGARQAEAGEFTARAYFNHRIDLTRAEGVAAMVSAVSERQRRAARQLLAGELSDRLRPIREQIIQTLALLEVGIDFSDEDVTFIATDRLLERLTGAAAELQNLIDHSVRLERLSHEPTIVLVGQPNAGKSTLMNALAGHERAVVSDIAGTTRDVLSAEVDLPAGRVVLLDAAGIDFDNSSVAPLVDMNPSAAADQSSDRSPQAAIERDMRSRSLRAIKQADVVVLVIDGQNAVIPAGFQQILAIEQSPDLIVLTKGDLVAGATNWPLPCGATLGAPASTPVLSVSALTGQGMEQLRHQLSSSAFGLTLADDVLALNARHVRAIQAAIHALELAGSAAADGTEMVALGLREALNELGSILGSVSPDELLGEIFSQFCIGK